MFGDTWVTRVTTPISAPINGRKYMGFTRVITLLIGAENNSIYNWFYGSHLVEVMFFVFMATFFA